MQRYATEGDLIGISFGLAFLVLVMCGGLFAALIYGSNKQEIVDCTTWSQQADAYPGFFLAKWQKDQCDAHQIIINAPVK